MFLMLLGVLAMGAAFYLLRWFSHADPKNVRRSIPWGAVAIVLLVLVVLAGTGRIAPALAGLTALIAWGVRVMSMIKVGTQFTGMFRRGEAAPGSAAQSAPPTPMMVEEAYRILGLKPGAAEEDIKAAYKRVIGQLHPDRGGTDYLAAKVNQAKDLLLGKQ